MPRTVVLDCRWVTFTGAGRVVELLFRGLRLHPPRDRWTLWGPSAIGSYAWNGATLEAIERGQMLGGDSGIGSAYPQAIS